MWLLGFKMFVAFAVFTLFSFVFRSQYSNRYGMVHSFFLNEQSYKEQRASKWRKFKNKLHAFYFISNTRLKLA